MVHWNAITFRKNSWHSTCTSACRTYWEIFKATGLSMFYTKQVVFISKHLVFYSTTSYMSFGGYATNWNSTGNWDEIYRPPSKFRVKLLQTLSRFHHDNARINYHIYFYINTRISGIFRHSDNFIGPVKLNWITPQTPFNISHIFRSIITWSQSRHWREYYLH